MSWRTMRRVAFRAVSSRLLQWCAPASRRTEREPCLTPELVGSLIDRFGLPVAILVTFAFLIVSGKLRPGSEVDRQEAAHRAEAEYRERLRLEERETRLALEKRMAEMINANRELSDGFRELERTVLRDQRGDSPGAARRQR